MKNKIMISTISLLILFILTTGSSDGQTTTDETMNSFIDCYSKASLFFYIANMFSPYTFDLTDPKLKKMISAACNFYYEKSGIWIDITKDTHITDQYGSEFWNQYPKNEIPQGVMEFWKDRQK